MQYISHIKSIFGLTSGLIIEFFTTNSSGTCEECIQLILEEYSSGKFILSLYIYSFILIIIIYSNHRRATKKRFHKLNKK